VSRLKREDHGKEVVGSETGDTVCSRRTPRTSTSSPFVSPLGA
jgi:hypothetical protein